MEYVLKRIKEKRDAQKLKQEYMAELLGIRQEQYSKWETGQVRLRLDDLFKISGILNCSVISLIEREEDVSFEKLTLEDEIRYQKEMKESYKKDKNNLWADLDECRSKINEYREEIRDLKSDLRAFSSIENELEKFKLEYFTIEGVRKNTSEPASTEFDNIDLNVLDQSLSFFRNGIDNFIKRIKARRTAINNNKGLHS